MAGGAGAHRFIAGLVQMAVAVAGLHIHDPTTLNRQGNDTGTQYRSGIYVSTPEQEAVARELLAELTASKHYDRPIVTEVLALQNYWPAEAYHQDFFARNPNQGYCMAVAAPKVAKFRKTFARLQKP
jgi:peptide-methionine (S)-S-oxide reductase